MVMVAVVNVSMDFVRVTTSAKILLDIIKIHEAVKLVCFDLFTTRRTC